MSAYLPILTIFVLVVLFLAGSFLASTLLGPRRSNAAKRAAYECGIVPEVSLAERFPVKFYLVAIAFIILDVEIIFLYPFATILRALGGYGLSVMGIFLLVLLVPFAYLLSVGALSWGATKQAATSVGEVLREARRGPADMPAAPAEEEAA
ncbi:MAG: dehydrogenase subunit [Actinomycetia bacterium]|nr:dehydrogenase subunit [Actinomycetes bacterium]